MKFHPPKRLHYRVAQIASWVVATFIFKRKVLRNEIKGKKGAFVVVANHQAALDFVNLIGLRARPMSFVISSSFYNSLPLTGFMDKMGIIPKQQFQTTPGDLKTIKSVVDSGEAVVIYPTGLMCEDGLSTPIPGATYKFLKWLKCDVYVAKVSGTYFAMPKWAKGLRPGRTYIDVYKLLGKEELASMELDAIREKTDDALLFDAYREQEKLQVSYKNGHKVQGLQHVLYQCPHCMTEFSMQVNEPSTLCCEKCGYAQTMDKMGFFRKTAGDGEEYRYVSDWSSLIHEHVKQRVADGLEPGLSAETKIHMIDPKKHKFAEVGEGTLTLSDSHFVIDGVINGERVVITVPIADIPTLPFSPGKHLEVQQGDTIYRCALKDGRLVMKFIHLVKSFYELRNA